ncbi:hypothetical protein ACQKCH_12675 [Nubsella zeaxanthinifaciens]|uniref:hypothetical protein n=1 Tax=Nubsella zeaxanthinifaciens TaxID=392412 RepID=UPI003D03B4A9
MHGTKHEKDRPIPNFKNEGTAIASKQQRKNNSVVKDGRTISRAYDYDIYTFKDTEHSRYLKLATINKDIFFIKNATFVKRNGILFEKIKGNDNIYFDSTDAKNFPYRRIFVVEALDKDKFKVIQVNTYIGSDY